MIKIRKRPTFRTGWSIQPEFQIKLHKKDIMILEEIKNTLGVGTVTKDKLNTANFNVWSIKELQVVIDHFDKFPLKTQKFNDYDLFKKAYYIIINKEHLTKEGLDKLIAIKSLMNKGLSTSGDLVKAFPHVKSQPIVKKTHANQIPNPNWLSGFASGEGSFQVDIKKNSNLKL